MSEQNDRVADGDEPPPEAGNYPVETNPPDDEGNADAELKERAEDVAGSDPSSPDHAHEG